VLQPLLSRTDLTPDSAQRAISTALTWLDDHPTPEAQFVLNPLLSRTDLTPDSAQRAISTALTWLDDHATTPEAGFVLQPLLSRTDLTPDSAQRAISTALTWLDDHPTPEAGFVLNPLLSRTDLTPDSAQRAISTALTWLDDHATTPEADFVMGALLKCLPVQEIPSAMTGVVEAWISKYVPERDFTYLSKWVLRKQLMSQTIFDALLGWAHANPDNEDLIFRMASAGFQVGPYLISRESSLKWLGTIELCLDHAERRGSAANLNGALDALIGTLTVHFRTGVGAALVDDCIQRWLTLDFSMNPSVFRPQDEVVHRCHAMALSGRFDEAQWGSIAKRLRDWVTQWPQHEKNDKVLEFIKSHLWAVDSSNL
ncbi:hypothetical protein, partial [Streptomyces sp. NPDC052292]|uniref:hypothetical protein n=1 Tax=Streptomyces sp. NPDC052292 TaxID=3155053 RepID=UPI00341CC30C